LAYVGSSNFSPESSNNYECGVLISIPKAIQDIRSSVVDYLAEFSAPRDVTDIGIAKLAIQKIRNRVKELTMAFDSGLFEELGDGSKKIRVFKRTDAAISQSELKSYVDF